MPSSIAIQAGAVRASRLLALSTCGVILGCAPRPAPRALTISAPSPAGLASSAGGSRDAPSAALPAPLEAPPATSAAALPARRAEPARMVRVPAGTYQMGSDEAAGPRETVHVAAFEIDVTEVTVGDYAVCVKSGACSASGTDVGSSCGYGHAGAEREPMTCVDWIQARDYCGSVGKRLPTEDEWEFAARGTDGRRYPWGNQYPSDQLCWKGAGNTKPATPGPPETYPRACDVGSYPSGASPFGALDMAGNVWEWTASPWCRPGSAKKVGCAEESRVMRGGTWGYTDPKLVRATERAGQAITDRSDTFGFRCAR